MSDFTVGLAQLAEVAQSRAIRRERLLLDAVLVLEGGVMPPPEEIARRGRSEIGPDGKRVWFWDKTVILTEDSLPWFREEAARE